MVNTNMGNLFRHQGWCFSPYCPCPEATLCKLGSKQTGAKYIYSTYAIILCINDVQQMRQTSGTELPGKALNGSAKPAVK
jgi:hypothetical protein